MNRELTIAEWGRAGESLRAAELLTREEYYADAVSRSYDAILHAAKAAPQVHDIAADSHAAVRRLFGLHLIRSGELEKEWAGHLGKTSDDRLAADYDAEVTFSEKEARQECRRARHFIRRVRSYLLQKGFTARELRRRRA